jgi:phytol kinase
VSAFARTLQAQSPWIAISLAMTAFLTLIGALAVYRRTARPDPEAVRKLLHTGSGLLTLSFPFLFRDVWPVLLLTSASATLIGIMKFVPAARRTFGGVVNDVGRTTLGEIYFPVAVAVVFWLSHGKSPLLFCIPVLMLTLADATCALVGSRYGQSRYEGANKSLEGSVAFIVVAFLCVHIPLLLWSDAGRAESLLIGATLALVVMLLEGSAWRGLDNLFIPLGGFFLLSVYLTLDLHALLARFCLTAGLVATVLLSRHATTMADDALLAGAFLAYLAWVLAGWSWLVPPAVVYVGYAWVSPRTEVNSRRVHAVGAMLSVWAAAVFWLVVGSRGQADAYFPYTLVFAAHLAMFGTSRLAADFPTQPLWQHIVRATLLSWALLFVPYAALTWSHPKHVAAALLAGPVLAGVAVGFARSNPSIRDLPLTLSRWCEQAAWAAGASIAGWLALHAIGQSFSS